MTKSSPAARGAEGVDTTAELVGRALEIPAWVFPRDKLPKGKTAWSASVTGISIPDPNSVFVRIKDSPDEFFFPMEEVQKWLTPVSPDAAHSVLRRSTRSRQSTRRTAAESARALAATASVGGRKRRSALAPAEPRVADDEREDGADARSQSAEVEPSAAAADPEEEGEGEGGAAGPPGKRRALEGRTGWAPVLKSVGAEAALGVVSSMAAYAVAVMLHQAA
ncbi:hypothetical protein ACKKBG_A33440 [Auxenochlorella protothecoides x Auxenochlorella symbiontica]|uniref:Uncharacterized protein n=1 Tax=Auxenochlorella protothecoides TaxID=3075 RepID=A0A1D2A7Y7_AUXPR